MKLLVNPSLHEIFRIIRYTHDSGVIIRSIKRERGLYYVQFDDSWSADYL